MVRTIELCMLVCALAASAAAQSPVFVGTPNGVYKSLDAGQTWQALNNSLSPNVSTLAIDPSNRDVLYAGTDHGLFRTGDGGLSWNQVTTSNTVSVAVDPGMRGRVYSIASGLWRSDDAGANWLRLTRPPSSSLLELRIDPWSSVFVRTANAVLRSDDGGLNWTSGSGKSIQAISADSTRRNRIYSAFETGAFPPILFGWVAGPPEVGIYSYDNPGGSWNRLSIPVDIVGDDDSFVSGISAIAIGPAADSALYACVTERDGLLADYTYTGILWRSSGAWHGKDGIACNVVAVDPAFPSIAYAAGTLGIYSIADGVVTDLRLGMRVTAIVVDPSTTVLVDGAVRNAASPDLPAPVAPDSIIELAGNNLARGTEAASNLQGALALLDTSVSVDGVSIPLLFVSNDRIVARLPASVAPGASHLEVRRTGSVAGVDFSVAPVAPAFFNLNPSEAKASVFVHSSDFRPVRDSDPASPGEFVSSFGTGLGAGSPAGSIQLDDAVLRPQYLGPAPDLPGVFQLNFQVPLNTAPGTKSVSLVVGGVSTKSAPLSVR